LGCGRRWELSSRPRRSVTHSALYCSPAIPPASLFQSKNEPGQEPVRCWRKLFSVLDAEPIWRPGRGNGERAPLLVAPSKGENNPRCRVGRLFCSVISTGPLAGGRNRSNSLRLACCAAASTSGALPEGEGRRWGRASRVSSGAGVPPASFGTVGSRGPRFSVTQLTSYFKPHQLPVLEHAVASAAPAVSCKSLLHPSTLPEGRSISNFRAPYQSSVCHNLFYVRSLSAVAEEADHRGTLR
jgi:hypothetical protein